MFSGCKSKQSSLVLKIQIFHSIVSAPLISLFAGKNKTFPLQVAAGDSVRKTIGQSMNC